MFSNIASVKQPTSCSQPSRRFKPSTNVISKVVSGSAEDATPRRFGPGNRRGGYLIFNIKMHHHVDWCPN